jgi:hypothetical protein
MKQLTKIFVLLALQLFALPALAVIEVGATANYRKSVINEDNYQESLSYTGSISYYFWEMSALELSYTDGTAVVVIQPSADESKFTITSSFYMAGADLVFTLAGRDSPFQPYIKLGGAYMEKKNVREVEGGATTEISSQAGIAPSAGLGFKIMLTKTFSIKVGVDAWTSPMKSGEDTTVDYAGRAGFSWFL